MEVKTNELDLQLLTHKQLQPVTEVVNELIDTLPPNALKMMLDAYEKDEDKLLNELLRQTHYVLNHNASVIDSEKLGYHEELATAFDDTLKKYSLNYFAATVPNNFDHGWRTLEWGNLLQLNPWSAYLCQRGSGKSMSPRELVVMADGTYKEIQYIKVGDKVMGLDSTPRTVLSTHRGIDDMYEVEQANTENYITNSEHILHFKRGDYVSYKDRFDTTRWKMIFDEDRTQIIEMPTKEFHKKSKLYKSQSFGYRVKGWDLPERELKIEPYFLGLWLGDGSSNCTHITNIDKEVIYYLGVYAESLNCDCNKLKHGPTYTFKKREKGLNILLTYLRKYNLLNNKHIPEDYLLGSRQQRLELLAGLIDSDGTVSTRKTSYSITQKNKALLEQIQKLCWSLGFRANIKERKKKLNYKNNEIYTSYDLHFSGDIWDIPCKIERKKIKKYNRVQDSQRSKLNTKLLGKGEYCGFECDGDKLFLLKDGTVVHNSYFFCYVVPLWRLYTYDPPERLFKQTRDNKNRKETAIITNESRLGELHIAKITEQIRENDILSSKLNRGKKGISKESVITDTGSMLHLRSFGSMIRGLHVGMSITDDFLNKSALYSKNQRDKFHEVFYAETMNIVEPGGLNVVSGCVNPKTIILTQKGLRKIGDLCPQSYKQTKKLLPYKESVLGKHKFNETSNYWCNGISDNYKITTKFGYNLEGSDIHPVLIIDTDGEMKWRKMPDLKQGSYVCLRLGQGFGLADKINTSNFSPCKKDNSNHIFVDDKLNKDWLYFFGLWIADGCFDKTKSGFTIIKNNQGIRKFVLSGFNNTNFKVRKNDPIKMDFNSVELKQLFDIVGCSIKTAKDKTIPKKIFESDRESLKYFLQGLFDGDGCFYVNKKNKSAQINLSSVSFELINQVQLVLLHFGICSSVNNRGISISDKVVGKNDLFSLNITGYDVDLFLNKIGFRFSNKPKPYIKGVEARSKFRKVPHQSNIFRKIRKEIPRIKRNSKIGILNSQAIYNSLSSKVVLKECLKYFKDNGAKGTYVDIESRNLNNDYLFLPIEKIEKTKGWTVDFVIPEDHTFLSNGIISHNTPFHTEDLYGDLKEDHRFKVFEYPGVFPNGDLLAPDRFTFRYLMDMKKTLGSIVFSREILVSPISDDSTIFPWEYLDKSKIGMENISLVENRSSYPIKLRKVVIGCDFAISGNVKNDSDFTVFTVWGIDGDKNYYLLNIWRKRGASHNEQVDKIVQMNDAFRPNVIVCENNGFQRIIADLARQRGLKNIKEFTTTSKNKKDDLSGLPSLSAMFERGEIRVPWRDGDTRDRVTSLLSEFNSITFDDDKGTLESASGHDDQSMSSFIALTELRENSVSPNIYYV